MASRENPPLKPHAKRSHVPSSDLILHQLRLILDSPEFEATKAQRAFLEYVVIKTVEGKSDIIKGYTLATELFGRGEDFDQNLDPVVSIHANKLRRALERYYLVAGEKDPVRIDIPKGTYVPTFIEHQVAVSGSYPDDRFSENEIEESWPTLIVLPFENLTNAPENDHLCIGIATELALEISRYEFVRVLYPSYKPDPMFLPNNARFIVSGNVRRDRHVLRVSIQMTDALTGKQIMGDSYQAENDEFQTISFQEKVAHSIAAKTAGEFGAISKVLSAESKGKSPAELKAYEAVLRYHEYDQTLTHESFTRAMEALDIATRIEPDCGQIWSMLGRMYADNFALDLGGFKQPLNKAIRFSEKGVRLAPENQQCRAIMAFVFLMANELSAAIKELERALELNPNSLFFLDGIGFVMTLSGDWERGPALIRKTMKLNPYYRPVVHHALWVDCLHRGNYEGAYLETMSFKRPELFWYPLSKAATLGLLGRCDEGTNFVKTLLELKPGFKKKGRMLIERYVKHEEIVKRVLDGLNKAGLSVD